MSDNQNPFRDHLGPIKPGMNHIKNDTGRPEYVCYNPRRNDVSDKFYQTIQNFDGTTDEYKQQAGDYARKRSNRTMTRQRTPMNTATAIGTLLILVGIITLIPFGFGADRFLWIATGTGGAGVILLAAGAFAPKE